MKKLTARIASDTGLLILAGLVVLGALSLLFGWIVNDSWSVNQNQYSIETGQTPLRPLNAETPVRQRIPGITGQVTDVTFIADLQGRPAGDVTLAIMQGDSTLAVMEMPLDGVSNGGALTFRPDEPIAADGDLTLGITVRQTAGDASFSLRYGDAAEMERYDDTMRNPGGLTVAGSTVEGQLAVTLRYASPSGAMLLYWIAVGVLAAAWIAVVLLYKRNRRLQRVTFLWVLMEETRRYKYLISQLVLRDFNHKYRQSVLGVLWSFLNPLLTMTVQYLVFSYLFHNAIENFPVYLMTGIVFFNFFNEASTLAMQSVTGNAGLIKKVYMPRYIYPLSKVLFALLNVTITLIPLFVMILITGVPVTRAALLLPLPLLGIACFALGLGMILATMNVFFRDTAFLWNIVVLLWTYMTPLFYPESIIPASWLRFYHLNPMYQFIYFIRCILLQGVTPQPRTYLICLLYAAVPLLLGFLVFRKKQNDFIYYL